MTVSFIKGFNDIKQVSDRDKEMYVYYGTGYLKNLTNINDMYMLLEAEQLLYTYKRRKWRMYMLTISFSDELSPDNPEDIERAETITYDIVKKFLPDRTALIMVCTHGRTTYPHGAQRYLHGQVVLNNTGESIWKGKNYLRKCVDDVTMQNGLTPFSSEIRAGYYNWREELGDALFSAHSIDQWALLGIIHYRTRFYVNENITRLTFTFEDYQGRIHSINSETLSRQLGYNQRNNALDIFSLENLQQYYKNKRRRVVR